MTLQLSNASKTDRIVNSIDPDQTTFSQAVWSGSTLFALTFLSKNLGSLRYMIFSQHRFICLFVGYWPYASASIWFREISWSAASLLIFLILNPSWNINPHLPNGLFHPYQWPSPFQILGVSSVLFHFLFQIEIPVSKQWRPWSDAALCGVWSGSALFAYVPKMRR